MPGAYGHGLPNRIWRAARLLVGYGDAVVIRPALLEELEDLSEIETAAGVLFAEAGMAEVARMGRSPQSLAPFQAAGDAWVADVDGWPVGYILVEEVDGCLHVEQVSVHPDFQRQGIGRALLDHVATEALRRGCPALTLTTFVELPWNAPLYSRCGYAILPPEDETPGLRAIREHEASMGLDRWARCCMRRDL
jgi:GNAT superfamily N-acetyltransferase